MKRATYRFEEVARAERTITFLLGGFVCEAHSASVCCLDTAARKEYGSWQA
jgi:hypothetical protein